MKVTLFSIFKQFWHPKYWPTWLGLGAMWLLGQLPLKLAVPLGNMMGRLMYYVGPRRRKIAEINLKLCFPDWSDERVDQLLRTLFKELGISAIEMCAAWFAKRDRLHQMSEIEGQEHLDIALAKGNGIILLSGHFTNLEIGGCMLATHVDLCAMYRKHPNPLFETFQRQSRDRLAPTPVIRRNDIRGMVKVLRSNLPIWYAPDQDYGRKHSIFIDFFGVPAATVTATSRLAKMSKAAVVPFFCERKPDNSGYKLKLYPPIENIPSEDIEDDTKRVSRVIEQEIEQRPGEYLWVHRRFKTRPEGKADFYPPPKSKRGKARAKKFQ